MMQNNNVELFEKGNFLQIDENFLQEGILALRELQKIQERFNKNDTDTFVNELRDQIVGKTLGFNLINVDKHGFDCKMANKKDIFLEVKAASFSSSSWGATFNDTTIEKANCFKSKKLYLALAVWNGASDLLFICFGQNKKIGEYLEEKIKWFKTGHTVRSTQTISFSELITKYNFKICTVDRTIDDVKSIIHSKYKRINFLSDDLFVNKYDIDNYIN